MYLFALDKPLIKVKPVEPFGRKKFDFLLCFLMFLFGLLIFIFVKDLICLCTYGMLALRVFNLLWDSAGSSYMDYLETLPYNRLQQWAKKFKIRANQKVILKNAFEISSFFLRKLFVF